MACAIGEEHALESLQKSHPQPCLLGVLDELTAGSTRTVRKRPSSTPRSSNCSASLPVPAPRTLIFSPSGHSVTMASTNAQRQRRYRERHRRQQPQRQGGKCITDRCRTAAPERSAGRMRYALSFTSGMSIRHGSTTSPTVSGSLRPHASWRRYVRLIFPHSTASNRRADSGVTEATGRLLPALAPRPGRPARATPSFVVTAHTAAGRLASLQALSLSSHQMPRLTRKRSGRPRRPSRRRWLAASTSIPSVQPCQRSTGVPW